MHLADQVQTLDVILYSSFHSVPIGVFDRKRVTTSKFRIRERRTEIGRAIKAATTGVAAAVALIKTGGSKPA